MNNGSLLDDRVLVLDQATPGTGPIAPAVDKQLSPRSVTYLTLDTNIRNKVDNNFIPTINAQNESSQQYVNDKYVNFTGREQISPTVVEQINLKGIELKVEIAPTLPSIIAVPEQIKSLWNNLVSNAVKYTPDGGQIRILLKMGTDNALDGIVSDTGIGIPEEAQERLFSEFYRASNAKELEISGTGLGLVIIKRILHGLNGDINLQSRVNEGTTFHFWIPTHPALS